MPYNLTPIEPSKEATGQVSLPLARVKKIINADIDIDACSNNAAFAITVATEMFIQHLVSRSQQMAKVDGSKKAGGRKNIQYRDVAGAVAKHPNLEFLEDVVPKTITYRQFKESRARRDANIHSKGTANDTTLPLVGGGQRTLDQMGKKARKKKRQPTSDSDISMEHPSETNGDMKMGDQHDVQDWLKGVNTSPSDVSRASGNLSGVKPAYDAVRGVLTPRSDTMVHIEE